MDAIITGIGWVTAAGPGRGREGRGFAMTGGPLPALTRKDVFAEPNLRFGRQSEYSKVGLAAIAFALRDAELEQWSEKRPIGMVAASQLGCLSTDCDYFDTVLPEGGGLASPNLFAFTLSNCFLGEAAIQFGLTGSTLVVNDSDRSGLSPLRMALESLAWGESDTMLAGICDLPAPACAATAEPVPGALFMVLESGRQRPVPGYGRLALADAGTIRHEGVAVESFVGLAAASLKLLYPDPGNGRHR